MSRYIELDYVVSHCEMEATTHKLLSVKEGQLASSGLRNDKVRDEHIAKSNMADELARHFRAKSVGHIRANPEVETLAREIDPDAFNSHEQMVARIIAEGHHTQYALDIAQATYGERMDAALDQACESVQNALGSPSEAIGYDQGIEAAAQWHEQRAFEADRLEQLETVPQRKAKYAQRAKRHRLFAKQMREEFAENKARKIERLAVQARAKHSQLKLELDCPAARDGRPRPSGAEEGIPLAVQMAFMKKGEVFDDEGWS